MGSGELVSGPGPREGGGTLSPIPPPTKFPQIQLCQMILGLPESTLGSLYEGFGLPNLEAMAVGCPVVTSNAQSVIEVCGDEFDGSNGNVMYFDPFNSSAISNAVLKLTRYSSVELKKMTANARTRARLFSWEKAADKTFRVLERNLK